VISQGGQFLTVLPDFGYGWREHDPQRQAKVINVPTDFDFLVEYFQETNGVIVAVLGRVNKPGKGSVNGIGIFYDIFSCRCHQPG